MNQCVLSLSPFPSGPVRSVSSLLNLISKGVLSQAAKPPTDAIHRPPEEFLDWINQLPYHIQQEVILFSLPCSILAQSEKVCVSGRPGLAASQPATALTLTLQLQHVPHSPVCFVSGNPGHTAKEGQLSTLSPPSSLLGDLMCPSMTDRHY